MKRCILILAYKRPHDLKRCLAAVADVPQVKDGMPVLISCDGGPEATAAKNIEIAKAAGIPQLVIGVSPVRVGLGMNIYGSIAKCFENGDWDEVLFIPEDDIVSPHIVTVLTALQKWLSANFTSKHFVGSSHWCAIPKEEKLKIIGHVGDFGSPLAACIISRPCWFAMRDNLARYMALPADPTGHGPVHEFYKTLVPEIKSAGLKDFPDGFDIRKYFMNPCATSVDTAFVLCARVGGYSYITTYVNRVIDIGEVGEHATPEFWKKTYGGTALDVFDSDATISEFVVR